MIDPIAADYRWAWRSFFTGGACGIWLLFYGLLFGASRLSLGSFASKALYLGYLLLISGGTMLTFGAIGFISTGVFLRRIYSRIRID